MIFEHPLILLFFCLIIERNHEFKMLLLWPSEEKIWDVTDPGSWPFCIWSLTLHCLSAVCWCYRLYVYRTKLNT